MTIDTSLSPKSFAQHDFTDCHLTTADKIYNGIAEGDPKQLGQINNSVPESDQWYVRFAFFDKQRFGYESNIQKRGTWN